MGYDCPCGTSVGTRAHWCEWKQQQHASRVEALLEATLLAVMRLGGATMEKSDTVFERVDERARELLEEMP